MIFEIINFVAFFKKFSFIRDQPKSFENSRIKWKLFNLTY